MSVERDHEKGGGAVAAEELPRAAQSPRYLDGEHSKSHSVRKKKRFHTRLKAALRDIRPRLFLPPSSRRSLSRPSVAAAYSAPAKSHTPKVPTGMTDTSAVSGVPPTRHGGGGFIVNRAIFLGMRYSTCTQYTACERDCRRREGVHEREREVVIDREKNPRSADDAPSVRSYSSRPLPSSEINPRGYELARRHPHHPE